MSKRLAEAAALEQRLSELNGEEWNSDSEDDEEEEETTIPLTKDTENTKSKTKTSSQKKKTSEDGMSAVIYVGHIPHGFYEEQMHGFFTQFGDIERLRLSRSKKTGGSKGFAFIEFKDIEDTKIVADSMDKYLLAGKQLVVKQLHVSRLHSRMWKGANQKFQVYPTRKHHAEKVNKAKTVEGKMRLIANLTKKEDKKRRRLESLGIDYNFPGYNALLENATAMYNGDMIADEVDEVEEEVEEEEKEEEEEPTPVIKTKSAKKKKKSKNQ